MIAAFAWTSTKTVFIFYFQSDQFDVCAICRISSTKLLRSNANSKYICYFKQYQLILHDVEISVMEKSHYSHRNILCLVLFTISMFMFSLETCFSYFVNPQLQAINKITLLYLYLYRLSLIYLVILQTFESSWSKLFACLSLKKISQISTANLTMLGAITDNCNFVSFSWIMWNSFWTQIEFSKFLQILENQGFNIQAFIERIKIQRTALK